MRYRAAKIPALDSVDSARAFFAACFGESGHARESLWVVHLDDRARCIQLERYEGDETGIHFPVREIIVNAASHGSVGILLAHNHPSGDATPSASDRRATRRLATAAEAIGCRVVDHFIFSSNCCESFRAAGYL
jgi:DNA repair protein RadC